MPTERPNILLITTDQQRFDTCGRAKPPFMRTPHYDGLMHEGIEFTRAYADAPICVAARIGIMTGRYVGSHGENGNGPTSKTMGREGTLPTRLRALGYQTAAVGKMHFGPERTRHGFDEMLLPADYYNQMTRSGLPYQPMRHGLGQNELYPALATVPEALTLTSWIAEQSAQYIRERRDPTVPFFLWTSFSKPHPPLDPPEPYYSMYRNSAIPEAVVSNWSLGSRCPEAFRRCSQEWSLDLLEPEIIREARAAYYGLITQVDYNMGRIFNALQDVGLLNDTLIVYTSDHGELLGDHASGCKRFFHEGSAHIPFLLRLPKSWSDRRHGSTCDALATHADILPTLVSAAGGEASDVDGRDLLAVARGQTPGRDYLVCVGNNFTGGAPIHMSVGDGRWKYMYYPEGPAEQLFDLAVDPTEQHDLADEPAHKADKARLRAALLDHCRATGGRWLRNNDLPAVPLAGDSVADRRNSNWPGYHGEHYNVDVRH